MITNVYYIKGINQMQNLMHDPRVVRGSTYAAKLDNTNNASKGILYIYITMYLLNLIMLY